MIPRMPRYNIEREASQESNPENDSMAFYCILYEITKLRNFATIYVQFCLDLHINVLLIKF